MEFYIGVKLVKAEPQLRGYFMGLTTPNQAVSEFTFNEEGYKVEYDDGYISWSPKDIFERSYRKAQTGGIWANWTNSQEINEKYDELNAQQKREVRIVTDLLEDIRNLALFISADKEFDKLSSYDKNSHEQQLHSMQYYSSILTERISKWKL